MTIELYLIRHGESEINKNKNHKDVFLGRNSWSELTEKGIFQSKSLGGRLIGIGFDKFFSSSTVRTQQTARYCIQEMGYKWPLIEIVSDLAEMDQGSIEGLDKNKIMTPEIRQSIKNYWKFIPPGGRESKEEVYKRVYSWMNKDILQNKNLKAAIFTHETVLKCLIVGMFEFDDDIIYRIPIDNCQYILLKYFENQWSIRETDIKNLSELLKKK